MKPPRGPIKILHLLSFDTLGGTEIATFTLTAGMNRDRFENHVCFLGFPGPFAEKYREASIPHYYLHYRRWNLPRVVARLGRLLRKNCFDFVQCYGLRAELLGRFLGRLLENSIIVSTKRSSDRHRTILAIFVDWLTQGLVDWYISNSRGAVKLMVGRERKPQDRIFVISNGINLEPFQLPGNRAAVRREIGIPHEEAVIICVARLCEEKGHRYLLEAVGLLRDTTVPFRLALVGSGPLGASLREQATRMGLDNVLFLGDRTDIRFLLSASDIFGLASYLEGSPNAVLEAMAAGLPVVVSDWGEADELVEDGVTGRIVPARDPQALALALQELLVDPALRSRMGEAGKRVVASRFSSDRMIKEYEDLYDNLLMQRE